jgi:subtilase family serine protease
LTLTNTGDCSVGRLRVGLTRRSLSSLAAHKSISLLFLWTATCAQGDDLSALGTVEANHQTVTQRSQTVHLNCPRPDLFISSLSWTPLSPTPGQAVTISVTVKNIGQRSARSFKVQVALEGTPLPEKTVTILSPQATATLIFSWTAACNSQLRATVDPADSVKESDEQNNESSGVIDVQSCPHTDLEVTGLDWTPLNPLDNQTVHFTVTVSNRGTRNAGYFHVGLALGETALPKQRLPGLAAGASVSVPFAVRVTCTMGLQLLITANADLDNQVPESDELNNRRTAQLILANCPAPDLIISAISWTPQMPIDRQSVTFNITVQNVGQPAAGPSHVGLFVGGALLPKQPIPLLQRGASATAQFTLTAICIGGIRQSVTAIADLDDEVRPERDEKNNTRPATIHLNCPLGAPIWPRAFSSASGN